MQEYKSLLVNKKSLIIGAVTFAVISIVGFGQYRNYVIKNEIISYIHDANENAKKVGSSVEYSSIDCGGVFSTDCTIKNLETGSMFLDKVSIGEINIKNVQRLRGLKEIADGEKSQASFDIELNQISIPDNVIDILKNSTQDSGENYFLDIFKNMSIAIKGDIAGSKEYYDLVDIKHFKLDNNIIPIELSLTAKDASFSNPQEMILEAMKIKMEYKNLEILAKEVAQIGEDMPLESLKQAAVDSIQEELDSGGLNGMQRDVFLAIADIFRGKGTNLTIDMKLKNKKMKLYELEEALDNPTLKLENILDSSVKVD